MKPHRISTGLLALFGIMTALAYWDEIDQNQKRLLPENILSENCLVWIKDTPVPLSQLTKNDRDELLKELKDFRYEKWISKDPSLWPAYGLSTDKPAFQCQDKTIYLGDVSKDGLYLYYGTEDKKTYLGGKQLRWILSL